MNGADVFVAYEAMSKHSKPRKIHAHLFREVVIFSLSLSFHFALRAAYDVRLIRLLGCTICPLVRSRESDRLCSCINCRAGRESSDHKRVQIKINYTLICLELIFTFIFQSSISCHSSLDSLTVNRLPKDIVR